MYQGGNNRALRRDEERVYAERERQKCETRERAERERDAREAKERASNDRQSDKSGSKICGSGKLSSLHIW